MTYRSLTLAALIGFFSVALTGCGDSDTGSNEGSAQNNEQTQSTSNDTQTQNSQANAEPVGLIFGTGGTSGSYYAIGGALKGVFERSDVIENVQVVSTGASVQNIQNIQDGLNQIAIVMSDVVYDAVNGRGQFEGNKVDLRGLAGLYPNVVQVVATAESGIHNVQDMAGKRIGVGQVGSGVEQSAKIVLEAAGLSYDDLSRVSHTGYADSVTEMSNGNLDAAFFTSGVPNSNITGLMQSSDITFVPIEGDIANKLLEAYPYYDTYQIPANAPERYGLNEAVDTVAIRNMLIVPASMRDDVAQELTKRLYDYVGSDQVSVGALKQFDRNTMDDNLVAPLHPGAKAFYDTLAQSDADQQSGSEPTAQ
ncbi:TAXI family TRAP transporter solute-binding subunit [Phytohalomonas tamaricis]|uniref:TAXI family TRAP transporter solute-binding subunit n=1 Tax=Phytohalomonas tamaricis TaxID=2081032 RepID=UPI000D0B4B57|nr:TAXI family TRAP transporter solute-binding subunit [Phytohalomonas tamaricis]